jgi:hypothetical protein
MIILNDWLCRQKYHMNTVSRLIVCLCVQAMVLQRAQKLSTNLIERANIVLPKRMNVVQ